MDYENKKALAIVKQMVADGQVAQDVAEKYFPELKENEDERIRKEMIEIIKNEALEFPSSVIANKSNSWIAWLEKQGEQKPVVDDKDAEKASEEYRNFRMSCGIKDPVMLNEIEEAFYEGAIRKQKPAEWSEEDETKLKSACALIRNTSLNGNEDVIDSTITFLKSLKGRVQPQREWSEEDEYCRNQLIVFCENCMQPDSGAIRCANWLKSLKERYAWKPSDEQMADLWNMVCECRPADQQLLQDLYFGLKTLRGE